jgi:hypothetical protein
MIKAPFSSHRLCPWSLTTHGYTGLKHVLLGSTAERVVRYAPCPVLTIRAHEAD